MSFESLKSLRVQGIGKFIHKVFMALTYPFRHGFKFFGLLFAGIVILAAIPMSQGVSYKHVIDWYLLKYDQIDLKNNFRIREKPEAVERKIKKEFRFKETAAPDRRHVSAELKKKMENSVTIDNADTKNSGLKRKTFKMKNSPFRHASVKNTWGKKNEEKPYFIKASEDNDTMEKDNKFADNGLSLSQPLQVKNDPVIPNTDEVVVPINDIRTKLSYRKIKSLPVVYEDNPEHIEGLALVFGANDLSVGDKYVILYGIYTDERRYDVEKAFTYLKELTDKKNVECEIVAYTHQHYATGICFLNGKSINQNMVDAGFADNIAL